MVRDFEGLRLVADKLRRVCGQRAPTVSDRMSAKGQLQHTPSRRGDSQSVIRTADDRGICTRSVTDSDENGAALH